MATPSLSLKAYLCNDPVDGVVYRHLFNGGSWFEADQMHWRICHERAFAEISRLTTVKPTKNNVERAKNFLAHMKEASNQLVSGTEYQALFTRAESMVAHWMAPLTRPAVQAKGFAALAESDEE
jgi:hypothetical protein